MRTLSPKYRVSFGSGDGEPQERVAGRDFRLDHRCLAEFFMAKPPPLLDDLLRIAASVYVVDRLAKRRLQEDGRSWPRRLRMSVEVLEPDFWSGSQIAPLLAECLEFVSGDCWEITFAKAPPAPDAHEPAYFPFTDPFVAHQPFVCLYSGGLDSAAGLVRRIQDCPGRPVIPVTVWHQPRQRMLVRRHFRLVKERCRACLAPVVVKAAMAWNSLLQDEERSQRCRPFLFMAVGGVVAAMQRASCVEVLESGVGAINLPLMAGMVGSKATRSCHPEFLRLASRLLTLAAGREIAYRLPFMDWTKGEMVRALAKAGLENLVRSTVSCVHFPLREGPHKQCGVCPACIFRRLAMMVGGIREPRGMYKFDLFGPSRLVNRIPEKRLVYLKAFLMQVVQLAALDSPGELPRRLRRHLFGSGVLAHGESPQAVVELLRRYRQEWLAVAAEGQEREWSWVKLLTPTTFANQKGLSHASA
jgi:7-cyano-7-deazaguanine synthase in queuosine biosynthesis